MVSPIMSTKPAHVRPSATARAYQEGRTWCEIATCDRCGFRAHWMDVEPETRAVCDCGAALTTQVGRWQVTRRAVLWGLWARERGQWQLYREVAL